MSRVTLKDVAKHAAVSIASASQVLNGNTSKVTPETAERIRNAASSIGYSKNQSAYALKSGVSNNVIVLMPQLASDDPDTALLQDSPFFSDFLSGIEKGASLSHLPFSFMRVANADEVKPLLNGPKPRGVIVIGILPDTVKDLIANWDLTTLVVDDAGFFERTSLNPCIINYNIDDWSMGRAGLEYLLNAGHKRIVLLFGRLVDSIVHRTRYEGILDLAKVHAAAPDLQLIETDVSCEGAELVFSEVRQMLVQRNYTAVLCMADVLAIGSYRAAALNGLKIPEDFSLVGMDNLSLLKLLPFNLTTVDQRIVQRGYEAVMQLVSGQRHTAQVPRIIEGETVKVMSR